MSTADRASPGPRRDHVGEISPVPADRTGDAQLAAIYTRLAQTASRLSTRSRRSTSRDEERAGGLVDNRAPWPRAEPGRATTSAVRRGRCGGAASARQRRGPTPIGPATRGRAHGGVLELRPRAHVPQRDRQGPLLTASLEVTLANAGGRRPRHRAARVGNACPRRSGQPQAVRDRRRAGQTQADRGQPAPRRLDRKRYVGRGMVLLDLCRRAPRPPCASRVRLNEGFSSRPTRRGGSARRSPGRSRIGAHHPDPGAHGQTMNKVLRIQRQCCRSSGASDGRGDRAQVDLTPRGVRSSGIAQEPLSLETRWVRRTTATSATSWRIRARSHPPSFAERERLKGRDRVALRELNPREQQVMRLRFGLDDGQVRTSRRWTRVGVTRERIRQIESKTLANLPPTPRSGA